MVIVAMWGAVAHAGVEVSLGGAGGGAFYEPDVAGAERGFDAAGSPVVSVQWEPWRGAVRPVLGVTSAPTFLYSPGYDAYTLPLLVADAGVVFGGSHAHAALTAHGGLLSVGRAHGSRPCRGPSERRRAPASRCAGRGSPAGAATERCCGRLGSGPDVADRR